MNYSNLFNPPTLDSLMKKLTKEQLNELVEIARKENISQKDIDNGLNFIKSINPNWDNK